MKRGPNLSLTHLHRVDIIWVDAIYPIIIPYPISCTRTITLITSSVNYRIACLHLFQPFNPCFTPSQMNTTLRNCFRPCLTEIDNLSRRISHKSLKTVHKVFLKSNIPLTLRALLSNLHKFSGHTHLMVTCIVKKSWINHMACQLKSMESKTMSMLYSI